MGLSESVKLHGAATAARRPYSIVSATKSICPSQAALYIAARPNCTEWLAPEVIMYMIALVNVLPKSPAPL